MTPSLPVAEDAAAEKQSAIVDSFTAPPLSDNLRAGRGPTGDAGQHGSVIAEPQREPIAIVGTGCRLPGGINDPEELWQALVDGRDCIVDIPGNRWDPTRFFDPSGRSPGPSVIAMFPGQGSQREGMAAHLIREHPGTAGVVFERADEVLGLPLGKLCAECDAEQLRATEIAQPAILATSFAIFEVLRAEGFAPDMVTGHSLGEFTALVAAGVLDLADALTLVRRRGELMAEIAAAIPGAMTAVSGVPAARIEEICAGVAGVVELANYNAPDQSVISGTAEAVDAAVELLREEGAGSLVALRVGAPFHCSLMASLEERFAADLQAAEFRDPAIDVLSSVTAQTISSGNDARDLLRRQLTAPVRWIEVIGTAADLGCTDYLEIGPGRVLSGLANRMLDAATVRSTQDARRIAAAIAAYA